FMINDSATVGVEIQVWFWNKRLNKGLAGHIDIVQIRNNMIHILDYNPNAAIEKYAAVHVYLYALGLSFRTGIKLDKFVCAWFDEQDYFECKPVEINLRFAPL
ncbi:MAG: hypothetical protein IIB89_00320, partial [Chloroflexi bacterium]|nr:hypothetical protein [Chloroflexota bacterium]